MKSRKEKQRKQGKVLGQGTMHKLIIQIIDIIERMYLAQNDKQSMEEFLKYLKGTTADEFYSLPINEKNENICM